MIFGMGYKLNIHDHNDLVHKIAVIVDDFHEKPSWYIAEKIIQLCFLDELEKIKDNYERLFYTDISNKN